MPKFIRIGKQGINLDQVVRYDLAVGFEEWNEDKGQYVVADIGVALWFTEKEPLIECYGAEAEALRRYFRANSVDVMNDGED